MKKIKYIPDAADKLRVFNRAILLQYGSRKAKEIVMKYISKRIASKEQQFEPLTPHTLRHTFATRCIERGMNPKTLQIILGHSAVHITMNLYRHVTDDMLISEMNKFENGANENPEGVIPINGVKVV